MTNDPEKPLKNYVYQLIDGADLSLGFVHGEGLGAVLLAVIAIVALWTGTRRKAKVAKIIKAWRSNS